MIRFCIDGVYMRVLAAQLNPTIGDMEGNARKIIETLDQARAHKIDIVLFAELALCGYPPEDSLLTLPLSQPRNYLEQILRLHRGYRRSSAWCAATQQRERNQSSIARR